MKVVLQCVSNSEQKEKNLLITRTVCLLRSAPRPQDLTAEHNKCVGGVADLAA
jgi:hypothetical protein